MEAILNILTLGLRPLYKKQYSFHHLIVRLRQVLEKENEVLAEVDLLYNELENLNFHRILFPVYYRKYIEHLQRLRPEGEDLPLELALLKIAIAQDSLKPTKPFPVFLYHLMYRNRLTSRPYISYQKKQNRKRLDNLGTSGSKNSPGGPRKEWTRVPLPKKNCGTSCNCH